MTQWPEYTRFFTALLVILDPFMAIPIFLAMTSGYGRRERVRVASVTALSVVIVLVSAAVFGEPLLRFLGTSLPSFRVGGGIVLLLMALAMLRAQPGELRASGDETRPAAPGASIAVVPLAIPLLAGPGAISTVIIQVHRTPGLAHLGLVVGVILAIALVLWLVLRAAVPIGNALGRVGLNVLNRLFGLILAAIAVEIMANGLKELFPVLAG